MVNPLNPRQAAWLRTSLPAEGPGGTRLAGQDPRLSGIPLRARRRNSARHADDLEAIQASDIPARLKRVCQVHPVGVGIERWGHSEEVASIARHLAHNLDLDASLAAAIGLAHDCGHAPFAHASEELLQDEYDSAFSHSNWGAERVLPPLGVSRPVIDGVRTHTWSGPACTTPEADVVRWADRIAYLTRDFADGIQAGLVTARDLPPEVKRDLGWTVQDQVDALCNSVIGASRRIQRVAMGGGEAIAMAAFRVANMHRIYSSDAVREETERQKGTARMALDLLSHRGNNAMSSFMKLADGDVAELLCLGV